MIKRRKTLIFAIQQKKIKNQLKFKNSLAAKPKIYFWFFVRFIS